MEDYRESAPMRACGRPLVKFLRGLCVALGLVGLGLATLCPDAVRGAEPPGSADPYLWLESVNGKRAMNWVRHENARTLAVLEKDPRFSSLYADALTIAESKERIPVPAFLGGRIYNFWRDQEHVRGLWRVATTESYLTPAPEWSPVLDLDALATAENANWVWEGADCLRPAERWCLVRLSDGGEDAFTVREFDLSSRRFVSDGFSLPKSKQAVTWIDADRLLVARDWGPGTMTASGYPFVVKILRRGEVLGDAREIFRGKPDDVSVELQTLVDASGARAILIEHAISFFEVEHYLYTDAGLVRLDVPLKSEIQGLLEGRLLVKLNEPWMLPGNPLPEGALVSIELERALAAHAPLEPRLVHAPGPRESVSQAAATRSRLLVTTYDNVRGRAAVYTPTRDGGWSEQALALPDNASIDIIATDSASDAAFLEATGFLTPTSLWLADAGDAVAIGDGSGAGAARLQQVKALPAQFDAAGLVVDQREATSKDGTRIPYFLVHAAAMKQDGRNPTILRAYGGFQISETPYYLGATGKLWLQRGGSFALANIRGGGEFGPQWHEAGLKTHRQRIYDDFAAVAEDLIATRVTSPRRLGISGGSNGGLLMGVELTQHPQLWRAVDIQVPLLDMLRYEKIAAGSSWVGEYGSVSNPDERAFLASISPYANLKRGVKYPEPFIWTTTKDDRVGPQHARKFAAKLAAFGAPYLYYEVIEGGHSAGANLKEQAHTTALEMTYFTERLMD